MGIRIEAYAVDVAAFGRLLERPLWRILLDLSQTPQGDDILFNVDRPTARYAVIRGRGIVRWTHHDDDASWSDVGEGELPGVPDLQQPLRDYVAGGSSFDLSFLLHDHPFVDGARYAREVTSGYKRWWIGSLLAAARGLWGATPAFIELAGYLARILRRWDCGFPLEPHDAAVIPAPPTFPVVPADDADNWMAVFDESETRRLVELLHLLMQSQPTFGRPPLDKLPDDETDWQDYVSGMAGRFLEVPRFELPNLHLVTFIG